MFSWLKPAFLALSFLVFTAVTCIGMTMLITTKASLGLLRWVARAVALLLLAEAFHYLLLVVALTIEHHHLDPCEGHIAFALKAEAYSALVMLYVLRNHETQGSRQAH